jgi:hypothetical protein
MRAPAWPGGSAEQGTGHDHRHYLAQHRHRRAGPAHRHAGRLPARPSHGPRLRLPGQPRRAAPEAIAEEAFAICNGHPHDAAGEDLSRRYYARGLRSLSFPGSSPCCRRSCCLDVSVCVVRDSARVCPCLPFSVRKMPPPGLILTVRRRSGFRWRCCWAGTGLDPDGDGDHDCGQAVSAGLASR